ncbi:hypothetical protein FJR38_26440 [Anabaena sp. UHCC 0253]|uniref:hypothetical protein n=1 Tax=Anabaena sp. UHCC 0253 TaxID=2590019 RepID=UPI00144523C4|nr:hypothetical protein [Anabaena sp. UHCC 0253]MTJ55945.1 hypothetical protein [Anabaena sp. UHCC 0253]
MNLESGWSLDGIRKSLCHSDIIGLLYNQDKFVCGYSMYLLPEQKLNDHLFLWWNAVCLIPEVQNRGFGRDSYFQVLRFLPQNELGYFGGRTQNPIVMKYYAKIGHLFPFDEKYDTSEGQQIMDFLYSYIPEVQETALLNKTTGICKQVYSEGRLGDYPENIGKTERFETQLKSCGFEPEKGDTVILVSKLRN